MIELKESTSLIRNFESKINELDNLIENSNANYQLFLQKNQNSNVIIYFKNKLIKNIIVYVFIK